MQLPGQSMPESSLVTAPLPVPLMVTARVAPSGLMAMVTARHDSAVSRAKAAMLVDPGVAFVVPAAAKLGVEPGASITSKRKAWPVGRGSLAKLPSPMAAIRRIVVLSTVVEILGASGLMELPVAASDTPMGLAGSAPE